MFIFIPIPRKVIGSASAKRRAICVGYIDAVIQALGIFAVIAISLTTVSLIKKQREKLNGLETKLESVIQGTDTEIRKFGDGEIKKAEDAFTQAEIKIGFVLGLAIMIEFVLLLAAVKLIQSTYEEMNPVLALRKAKFWYWTQMVMVVLRIIHLLVVLSQDQDENPSPDDYQTQQNPLTHYSLPLICLFTRVLFFVLVSDHIKALRHNSLSSEAPALVAVEIPYKNMA